MTEENFKEEIERFRMNRLEKSIMLGMPVVFGVAPIAYTLSQCDWSSHPIKSLVALGVSGVLSVGSAFIGALLGYTIALGSAGGRRVVEHCELLEGSKKTYERLLTIEERGDGEIKKAFERGEVNEGEICTFVTESNTRGDYQRVMVYGNYAAECFEKEGFMGLASAFRTTARNAKNAHIKEIARQAKEHGQMI